MSATISKESIVILQPSGEFLFLRYQWNCPQCGTATHGDQRKDSIFEIRHDPLCIYCRVKNGEFRLNGSSFERVKKEAA